MDGAFKKTSISVIFHSPSFIQNVVRKYRHSNFDHGHSKVHSHEAHRLKIFRTHRSLDGLAVQLIVSQIISSTITVIKILNKTQAIVGLLPAAIIYNLDNWRCPNVRLGSSPKDLLGVCDKFDHLFE